ncbi:hypothetical protein H6P81_004146 [Aristolochia fimbriata]|uniref:Uncharacterized protein n=1 Tax=Aristolochia fimbriata TaxID=158543 RepID=A0AAV7FES0_ARIFI|nr:hypothetical protein H6P81_004146 [Aristolochia fimbriata]
MPKRSLAECEEPSKDNKEQLYNPSLKELENYGNFMPVTDNGFGKPIVSEEPNPPKRKRRSGGCNLRKSLAWNSAFFTEEGVLDPDELSNLTCPLSECDENLLHTVNGEKTLQLPESYKDGCNLKELDENLFKELGTGSINEENDFKSRFGVLECSPKQGHSFLKESLAVHSTKNLNKSVSRHGGCPGNATIKSSQSTPAVKIVAKIASKSTPSDKFGCTASSIRSFSNNTTSTIRSFSNSSKENSISLPQLKGSTQIGMSNVGSKTNLEPNMNAHAKPSRLRMPSPSLGFFSQAKSSIPQSINSQKNNEHFNLPESCLPISRKHSMHHSRMSAPPKFKTSAMIPASSVASSSMLYNSVHSSKCAVPSEITAASVSTLYSSMKPGKLTNLEMKCQSDSSSLCNPMSVQACSSSEKEVSVLHARSLPCGSVLSCNNGIDDTLSVEASDPDSQPQKLLKVQEQKGLSDSTSSSNQRAGKICFLSIKMDLTPNPDSLPCPNSAQNIDNELTCDPLSTEVEVCNPECSRTEDGVAQDGSKEITSPSREKDAAMLPVKEKLMVASKPDLASIKINAAPFSDEWLAAIEAAGEDVLKMKTGAVQNSPPEKTLPEPSPWSPVKRNSNAGPFDCTKYTVHPTTTDS